MSLVANSRFRFGTALVHANLPQKFRTMQRINYPQEAAQKAVEAIQHHLTSCTVFVWGYRKASAGSGHFDLLVLSKNTIPGIGANIANTINEQSGGSITASVLVHKNTDLAKKQPHQQRFFDNILRNGQRLCLDKSSPPYLLADNIPPKDEEGEKAYWLKCVAVAQFSIQAAAESPHQDVELCKIALLNTACVQIALGLIRLNLGYTPNEFSLNYLLNLCGNFSDLPTKLFHQQTPTAIHRYKMLCTPPSLLNHRTKLNAKEQDFLHLLDACGQFLELSKNQIDDHYP